MTYCHPVDWAETCLLRPRPFSAHTLPFFTWHPNKGGCTQEAGDILLSLHCTLHSQTNEAQIPLSEFLHGIGMGLGNVEIAQDMRSMKIQMIE